jgi:Holliday junction resolvase RusA-like endonuclease
MIGREDLPPYVGTAEQLEELMAGRSHAVESELLLEFAVAGVPRPQGSKVAIVIKGRAQLIDQHSKTFRQWRKLVNDAAVAAIAGRPALDGALEIELVFRLERGSTVKRELPTVAPDLDKLTRAVFDALKTGGAIVDDARVVELVARKEYGDPGVHVWISRVGVSPDRPASDGKDEG